MILPLLPLIAVWAQPAFRNPQIPIDDRVKDLLGRMSLEEKARQLDMYTGARFVSPHDDYVAKPGARAVPEEMEKELGSLGVGSIHDLYPTPAMYNAIQKWVIGHNRLGIPALFIEEGLHGFSDCERTGTIYPESVNLASTWNVALAEKTGAGIGSEARSVGVDLLLCPVLDVAREPRWGRVEEDFGEDPYLTGELAAAYVHGMQGDSLDTDHTVASEPKHFAGHGSPESGLNTAPVHAGEREVRSIMLRSFQPAFTRSHAMGAMAAYHEIDGVPCTANSWLLTQVLRGEWGFKGIVISDLGAIHMLYDTHHVAATEQDAVLTAIKAGVDMQFYDFPHGVFQGALVDGVRTHKLSQSVLDRSVARVLRLKFALGLFDHPFVDPALNGQVNRSPQHLADALESARESMCLLKNEKGLLPLSKSVPRIALIGPNAAQPRTGDYTEPRGDAHLVSLLEGIKDIYKGDLVYDDGSDTGRAADAARSASVAILALGEREGLSGEGSDRSNLDLPGNQEQLLEAVSATGVPVVLVLQNGRPLSITWASAHVPAILEAWYPGERGGQVIAETLFGDNNPAGRLSISVPRGVGTLPDFYNYHPSKQTKYVDSDSRSLYPFGYGLSYTTFAYSSLRATAAGSTGADVEVDVTNTGKAAGDEVAQLYLRAETSSVATPRLALKGFQRIHLLPGETRHLTFHLGRYELEVWGIDRKWSVEGGKYDVYVGGSSEARLKANFELP